MADVLFNRGKWRIANTGVANLSLRAAVVTGTAVGIDNVDLNTVADMDAVVSVGIGTERVTLASVTVTEDDTNDRVNIDCADFSFAAVAATSAVAVVIYHEAAAADASRELVGVYTTGFPKVMDNGLNVAVADFARLT